LPVSFELLRKSLGASVEELPDDASDEQINAALEKHAEEQAQVSASKPEETPQKVTPSGEPKKEEHRVEDPAVPVDASRGGLVDNPNAVYVDREVWEQTKRGAAVALEHEEARKKEENLQLIDNAVRAGKIPPSRKQKYFTLLEGPDREGTIEWINSLEGSTVPLYEIGITASGEDRQEDPYPQEWLTPDERERVAASTAPGQLPKAHSRIVVEH